MVKLRYEAQKARGQKGFGFVAVHKGEVEGFWHSEGEEGILAEMKKMDAEDILFHHRNPTSTPNLHEAAHPILVSHASLKYDWYVCHNGVITFPDRLKEKHETAGFEYRTEIKEVYITKSGRQVLSGVAKYNDSEAFAIEWVRDMEDKKWGLSHVDGKIAFIAYQVDKVTQKVVAAHWGRNSGNPLNFLKTNSFFAVTSAGDGEEIKENVLYSYDYASKEFAEESYKVGYTYKATGYADGKEWDNEKREWVEKPKIGYVASKEKVDLDDMFPVSQLPSRAAKDDTTSIEDIAMYEELVEEQTELEALLAKGAVNEHHEDYLQNRLQTIKEEMLSYDKKYHAVREPKLLLG
jgi:predicted glutamine amidotransferase